MGIELVLPRERKGDGHRRGPERASLTCHQCSLFSLAGGLMIFFYNYLLYCVYFLGAIKKPKTD